MHTPAPWLIAATSRIGHHYIVDADGFTICDPSPMGEGNARLIAAAPDLLAFAHAVANYPGADAGLVIAARAAIAKALGE